MSIATTFQRAVKINRIDSYPMEILKRVDRPTTTVKEDEIMGYVPPNQKTKWWLGLEDVDGELKVPAQACSRGNFKPPG
jgi:hypothetical protein